MPGMTGLRAGGADCARHRPAGDHAERLRRGRRWRSRRCSAARSTFSRSRSTSSSSRDPDRARLRHRRASGAPRTRARHCRGRMQRLTPREREVMALVVAGKANKVVAYELGISQKTVEMSSRPRHGEARSAARSPIWCGWNGSPRMACPTRGETHAGALRRLRIAVRGQAASRPRSAVELAAARSIRTSSASDVAPSLCMTRARCASTVFSLMPNSIATTLFALPCTT